MQTQTVTVKGIELEVSFECSVPNVRLYENGQPLTDEPIEINIESICHEGEDLYDILSYTVIDEIFSKLDCCEAK